MITHYLVPGTSFDTWHLIWYLVPHLVPGSSSQILKLASRYLISDFEGGSLLRIEPVSSILFRRETSKRFQFYKVAPGTQVRKKKEAGAYECVAENGNGDPVSATADLTVFEGDEL